MAGRIDEGWAKEVRPFALASWSFLTIGIGLGAWWAYYELGWGGFWAWDPVENASFMPWLAGTALIHSIRVLEVRGAFKTWTALLAILTFSLSLIGTFLVRSGILTSVHAFAVDPTRGVFILLILGAAIGGGLTLFGLRAGSFVSHARFDVVSREGGLIANNILLSAATATVFWGTFYPLFAEIITGTKLSVGAPYFNIAFTPLALLSFLVMAPAASLAWKRGDLSATFKRLAPAAMAGAAAILLAAFLATPRSVAAISGAGLAAWAGAGAIADVLRRIGVFSQFGQKSGSKKNIGAIGARFANLPASYLAMTFAHIGVAFVAFGAIGAGAWNTETVVYANVGEAVRVGEFDAVLRSVDESQGPNYAVQRAVFDVRRTDAAG